MPGIVEAWVIGAVPTSNSYAVDENVNSFETGQPPSGTPLAVEDFIEPDGKNVWPAMLALLKYAVALVAFNIVVACYFVFVPLLHSPTESFVKNWSYGILQPFVVMAFITFGSKYGAAVLLDIHLCHRTSKRMLTLFGLAGGPLALLVFSLPLAFLKFFPFNWFAGYLIHSGLSYNIGKNALCPSHLRDAYRPLVLTLQSVGNVFLVVVIASIGFLVAFYLAPGRAQIFIVGAYNGVLQLSTWRLRIFIVNSKYPMVLYSILSCFYFIQEIFLNFAYPSAVSAITLGLMLLGQVAVQSLSPGGLGGVSVVHIHLLFRAFGAKADAQLFALSAF
eukprot:TRINITY_DN4259_c0_g1_i1.p1 TRINITY_DN4259_c0_g1~~TRINITY_DN4259_c0_g1_i1.p1  ORF type:complete len:333 (-),score=46.24 TRINITY_DN4259_c0_g1_i1:510-1508(-)